MVRILLHLLILPAMLWVEHRSVTRLAPHRAMMLWYLLGVPLMLLEALDSDLSWKWLFLQSLVSAFFFLPGVYAAFRLAKARGGIWLPLLVYLAFSVGASLLAGLALAHTPFAFGKL
ncbi:MAG: hypothetical protein WC866_01655 [Patescibacteria group bacterium]|jgi:hypothetical protein